MSEVSTQNLLSQEGPFARLLEGFSVRPQQQAMEAAIQETLQDKSVLVVEAGTGVGKTFAYLAPSLACGEKVLISTGTKNLQDQLFHKDLPLVQKALGTHAKTALLKGRSNYLCLHRLRNTLNEGRLRCAVLLSDMRQIERWAGITRQGDIAELADIPEDSDLWPRVTSTTDNCLGGECEDYQDCHVVKARRAAQEAELVVINHHLFFADLALKEEGFGDLLPHVGAVILDEAHQLPEVASLFFGVTLSGRQLLELSRDTEAEQLNEASDTPALRDAAQALEKATLDFRLSLGAAGQREPWMPIRHKPAVAQALLVLETALQSMTAALEQLQERGKGLQSCYQRSELARSRLERMREVQPGAVQWYETFRRTFALNLTPLDIAQVFQSRMNAHPCAWILTSATLAVDGRFEHFSSRLGLDEARHLHLDSPFDYAHNALMYLPEALPEPNHMGYTLAVVEAAMPVIEASAGRCFMLFTSHRALREAQILLAQRTRYPLFVQGSMSKRELIEQFRAAGNAILLGTSSFWEGVDVRGEALSLVIIDKLPFASPGDPVLQARLNAIRDAGDNPFMVFQLPQAVIALKQGAGRLIRDAADHGVLMLCDPRLRTKRYGPLFLKSLPPMPRTRDLSEVQAFFSRLPRPAS